MKAPFKCGQCGAKALYQDKDIVNNLSWIACMTCGNRWPGGFKPIKIIEGEDMANKKGTCTNCGRPDLNIANGKGHCYTCHEAGKGLEGEDLAAALLAAKERVNDPEYHRVGKKIETLPIASEKVAKIKEHVQKLKVRHIPPEAQALMTLVFQDETDICIFNFIESEAKRCRRTPDQQAIWMLQSHLPESKAMVVGE